MWGSRIGIVHFDEGTGLASFEYDHDFARSGIEVSPVMMPLADGFYSFSELVKSSFHGIPGLIADSLPDKFGNAVISQWLASRGLSDASFNAIDRLCYTGTRGMGALEYVPATGPVGSINDEINISEMVRFASDVLNKRSKVRIMMDKNITAKQLLQLGTSAGGARAKAVIAWNEKTGDIRSGQINAGPDYGYWIIKFDGVDANGDHDVTDRQEYTRIEYAYHLMAIASGIKMSECKLLAENDRVHFMTKRFDRTDQGGKIHMQTLGALSHIDYDIPCLCSYEQAAIYARQIGLRADEIEQLYRRMVFNVLAVNQDDHVKNISFLMDRNGKWMLAPAYDVTFAYDSSSRWLNAHQMTINGKNRDIGKGDILEAGRAMDISAQKCKNIIDDVAAAVDRWPDFAEKVSIKEETMEMIRGEIYS